MKTRKAFFVLLMLGLAAALGVGAAHAAPFTCTVDAVGPYGISADTGFAYIYLTDVGGTFANQKCKISGGPANRCKEFLAAALTAIASGKQVTVNLTTTATPVVTSILVLK
jgi:hypothetical protein